MKIFACFLETSAFSLPLKASTASTLIQDLGCHAAIASWLEATDDLTFVTAPPLFRTDKHGRLLVPAYSS